MLTRKDQESTGREGIGGRPMKPLSSRQTYRNAVIQFKNVAVLDRVLTRGDNRNHVAVRDLSRYYDLLDRRLPRIIDDLGVEPFAAAMAAMKGFVFTPDSARLAWAQLDGKVQPSTVDYVRHLDDAGLYAWCDAAERFHRGSLDLWTDVKPTTGG